MVVNTGRAASRAFYLNLRAQPGMYVPSRHDLDRAVSGVIDGNDTSELDALTAAYVMATRREPVRPVGLVFHGVRPRLAYPFHTDANRALLAALRDRFEIDHVFMVVRDPLDVFASEMNRRRAGAAGDWRFFDFGLGWLNHYRLDQIETLPTDPHCRKLDHLGPEDSGTLATAREVAIRTGKAGALVDLFASVFNDVHVLAYSGLTTNPDATFEMMGRISGWRFAERSLASTKLNGLANRLLVYNPITLDLGGTRVRFRFEVEAALELCEDWGSQVRLPVECGGSLTRVESLVGSPVGLGVDRSDLARLPTSIQTAVTSEGFAHHLLTSIGPTYESSFVRTEEVYRRDVYRTVWPERFVDAYERVNGDDIARCQRLIAEAHDVVERAS